MVSKDPDYIGELTNKLTKNINSIFYQKFQNKRPNDG